MQTQDVDASTSPNDSGGPDSNVPVLDATAQDIHIEYHGLACCFELGEDSHRNHDSTSPGDLLMTPMISPEFCNRHLTIYFKGTVYVHAVGIAVPDIIATNIPADKLAQMDASGPANIVCDGSIAVLYAYRSTTTKAVTPDALPAYRRRLVELRSVTKPDFDLSRLVTVIYNCPVYLYEASPTLMMENGPCFESRTHHMGNRPLVTWLSPQSIGNRK